MENRPFGRLVPNHGKRVLLSDYESKKKLLAKNEIVKSHLDEQIVQLTKDHMKKLTDIDDLILEDKKKLVKVKAIDKSFKLVEKANLGYSLERKRVDSVKKNDLFFSPPVSRRPREIHKTLRKTYSEPSGRSFKPLENDIPPRQDTPSQPAVKERAPFHGKNVSHVWKEEAIKVSSRSESFTEGRGERIRHKPIITIHAPSSSIADDIRTKKKDEESSREEQIFQQGDETDTKIIDLSENEEAELYLNFEGSVFEAKESKTEMFKPYDDNLKSATKNQGDAVFHITPGTSLADENIDNVPVVKRITLPKINPLNLRQTKSLPSTFLRLPNIDENSSSYNLTVRRRTYTEGTGNYAPNSTTMNEGLGRRNTIGTTYLTRHSRIESDSLNIYSQAGSYRKKKFISLRQEAQASSSLKGKKSRGKIPKDDQKQGKSLSELFKEMETCHYLRVTRRTEMDGSAEI